MPIRHPNSNLNIQPAACHLCLVIIVFGILFSIANSRPLHADQPKNEKLIVCALPAAMPRTGRTKDRAPQGIDLKIAQLVSHHLGRELEVHWCANSTCAWNCLPQQRCDVVIGQPHSSGPSRGVAWSVPCAGSQFGMVVSPNSEDIDSLVDLVGQRVGIVSGTVTLSQHDHKLVQFKTREDLLNRFHSEQLDGAFLDADFAAWYLNRHSHLKLQLCTDYVPRERWNVGFAVRASDSKLLVAINRALAQLSASGEIQQAYADHGVPYQKPFTNIAHRTVKYNSWKRIASKGEIVVSMDPANLPYSSTDADLPGFDVELARDLAKHLRVKLRINWIDVQRETAIGELLDQECDLAFGAAIDPGAFDDEEELAGKVVYSTPYYGTGYLLVGRNGGLHVRSLSKLKGKKSRRLGTDAGSVADYRLRQRGYLRRLFRNQLAVLKALGEGHIDYAYLWANVGWTLHTTPKLGLELAPEYVPEDHWNIAIAMRRGDNQLKRHVDAAVGELVRSGAVARSLSRYHVPYFPTFRESKSVESTKSVGHDTMHRGLQLPLNRRQLSKKSYGGLDRIRSAGELVVGLDQNNLPFSTAHPVPAGADYEIAKMLAERLGVSLRVYWAYSSHDSYPSKLATKKLCDIILGVMPDDRFGQRVLYTKPYYIAEYQLVVAAGDDELVNVEQLITNPLAIEAGVATRGVDQRNVKQYRSLQAVIAAVAHGEQKAGYVISTRGHWLARTSWPGKLKFIYLSENVDRFPISVAVRRSDEDLKQAIDVALQELADTGKISDVFARWHLPYEGSPHVE